MSRWFRFYDDAINDPKIIRLSDSLYRTWTGLLCIASKNGGTLPSDDDMALMLRMKPAKVEAAIAALIEQGLIDGGTDGKLAPHNWNARQYKSDVSTSRVKRFRNGKGNVSSDVSETPPETEQNRAQNSEPKGSGATAPPDPKADYFRRGRQVCGPSSGGLLSKLLKSQGNEDDPKAIAKARARIEDASTKAKPAEWIGRVMNGAAETENSFRDNPTAGSLI